MASVFRRIDTFSRNILIVFVGSSLGNVFHLLTQLLLAHRLPVIDFAAFNALLSLCTMVVAPLGTLQIALSKYAAGLKNRGSILEARGLIVDLLKYCLLAAVVAMALLWLTAPTLRVALKIPVAGIDLLLALWLGLSFLAPVTGGALQGMELFGWVGGLTAIGGLMKAATAVFLLWLGLGITAAIGAFLVPTAAVVVASLGALRRELAAARSHNPVLLRQFFLYLGPIAAATFCHASLISMDMVMVKYFFSPEDSGTYALAQMVGKIFFFLPAAISVVMMPRTSGLEATRQDTLGTLRRSLGYGLCLCVVALVTYNLFPEVWLRLLTGKVVPEAVLLGRLFSFSMSACALLYILVMYFLSVGDLRFLKYLIPLTIAQAVAMAFLHQSLLQVQLLLCVNATLLLLVHLGVAYRRPR